MRLSYKKSLGELKERGDYAPVDADTSVVIVCPHCGKHYRVGPPVHKVVELWPLTILPSIIDPSGCHYIVQIGQAS